MRKLNLGCGTVILDGWENIDLIPLDDRVIRADIVKYVAGIPMNDVGEVRAHHILEHLEDLDSFMYDLGRVCFSGAKLDIVVPLANTLWAIADPTHKRFFNHRTFEYYCDGFSTSYGRQRNFRLLHQMVVSEPNEWFDGIEWMVANLHVRLERI